MTRPAGIPSAVYQVVTTGSDGSQQRWEPLFIDRKRAVAFAEECKDHDPAYAYYPDGGRWRVRVERLALDASGLQTGLFVFAPMVEAVR